MKNTSSLLSQMPRRQFLNIGAMGALTTLWPWTDGCAAESPMPSVLPEGSAPMALPLEHFPTPVHAFIWRNWPLISTERMAEVLDVTTAQVEEAGAAMGLGRPPVIMDAIRERSALTVIRRNWHLLPYDQLLKLLGWDEEKLAFTLREDDFLFHKLGLLKPRCEPLRWQERSDVIKERERTIAGIVELHFKSGSLHGKDPLFSFVDRLSQLEKKHPRVSRQGEEPLRFCYSYFALYGDPLLEPHLDPYPDGYLQKLRDQGVNGVWLQAVLSQLAPFPWDAGRSHQHEARIENLRHLVERAKAQGIRIFLYLNEPRSMPVVFFDKHPNMRGVPLENHAALCTSVPVVRQWMRDAIKFLCQEVPELGGFFTITASENPTNCWSHGKGGGCSRCGPRGAAEVIAEVNATFAEGIREAKGGQRLLAWDWGWKDEWALEAIAQLPQDVSLMSVSEWSLPISRGGVTSQVGEYCLSAIGPGPRAKRHWRAARERGLKVIAKIQASLTWEFSAAPYLPVVQNVADHAANLKQEGVEEMMLSWTLGGHPSPNFAAVATPLPELARRYDEANPEAVLKFWQDCSEAFKQFPYHIGVVYNAPLQTGPANLVWPRATGYRATMVGFGYDDLTRWRSIYPVDVFIQQLEKTASGFQDAIRVMLAALPSPGEPLMEQLRFAEVAALHWESVALQARLIAARDNGNQKEDARDWLLRECEIARRLHVLQSMDSRIGFEASNQYYYVPLDLVEKFLACRLMLEA